MSGRQAGRRSRAFGRVLLGAAFAWTIAGLAPDGGMSAAEEAGGSLHIVTGTLSMLDLAAGKGMLKTDLGKPIFFEVSRPDLFSRITVGDRVTVQLDDQGRTIKVTEALVTELPPDSPPPPSQQP